MRVLQLINNLNREGAQIMVSNLVTTGNSEQVKYVVCVRQPGGSLAKSLREKGVCVIEPDHYYGFRQLQKSLRHIENAVIKNDIDLIHAHMADAAFLGWIVARKLKIPLVISHHGDDILMKCGLLCRSIYFVLLYLAARFAVMNVAVSESVAGRVRKLLLINRRNIQVIHNGVIIPDKSLFTAKDNNFDLLKNDLTLINVGRLVPLKGQSQLIHAVARLIDRFPDIKLYFVGAGPMQDELIILASSLHADRNIEFTGITENVPAYLEKADIYVSASKSEGLPVSILEAMAWYVPVIASDISGNRNIIVHHKTGFLYKLDNIDELVDTIINCARNPELRSSITAQARRLVESEYSTEVSAHAHETLYLALHAQSN